MMLKETILERLEAGARAQNCKLFHHHLLFYSLEKENNNVLAVCVCVCIHEVQKSVEQTFMQTLFFFFKLRF